MGRRFEMAVAGFTAGGVVALGAGCTGGPGPEGSPDLAPTTGTQEATPSPSPEATHIVANPSASPEATAAPTPFPERAGEIGSLVTGVIANTRIHGEVFTFTSSEAKVANGTFAEGTEIQVECFEVGAERTDTYDEQPKEVTWDKWLKVYVPEYLKKAAGERWVAAPYVNLDGSVEPCDEVLSTPSAD